LKHVQSKPQETPKNIEEKTIKQQQHVTVVEKRVCFTSEAEGSSLAALALPVQALATHKHTYNKLNLVILNLYPTKDINVYATASINLYCNVS